MKKMIESKFYGDNYRWFFATVLDRNDPDMLGRVQIRIHGIHSNTEADIPRVALPWAPVVISTEHGATSGYATPPQILPGATVYGFFVDGKQSQSPVVIGSLPKIEKPTSQQASQLITTNSTIPSNEYSTSSDIDQDINDELVSPGVTASRRLNAMKYFIDQGFNENQSAGIVGNLDHISNGFNTTIKEEGNVTTFGIGQWKKTGRRYAALVAYAKSENRNARFFKVQLDFIMQELNGKTTYSDFISVKNLLKTSTSFYGKANSKNASWVFMNKYEQAQDNSTLFIRVGLARLAYNVYMNNYITSSGAG